VPAAVISTAANSPIFNLAPPRIRTTPSISGASPAAACDRHAVFDRIDQHAAVLADARARRALLIAPAFA
jgi:hypothetical protein